MTESRAPAGVVGPPTPLDRLTFRRTRWREGYQMSEVDDFLDRAHRALELGDGSMTAQDVEGALFDPVRGRAGYRTDDVDTELDRIAAAFQELDAVPVGQRPHLARCVALAREALAAGDAPFGSVLVTDDGQVAAEARNREATAGDPTAHPELELALWARRNLSAEQRAAATVYTSGEHCPMCAAAHGWVGLGPIVFAASSEQLAAWRASWGLAASPVAPLPASIVLPSTTVTGPVRPYDERMRPLHEAAAGR